MRIIVLVFTLAFLSATYAASPKVQEMEQRLADLEAAMPIKVVFEPEVACTDSGQFADWVLSDGSPQIVDFGWCPNNSDSQFYIRHEQITPTSYVSVLDSPLGIEWSGCQVFSLWDRQARIECLRGGPQADALLIILIVP